MRRNADTVRRVTSSHGPLSPSSTQKLGDLYLETFVPASTPRGTVVVTHGYMEHCGRYREVANVIVRAGLAAVTWDVRGHGQSTGQRGYVERFEVYLEDLAAVIATGRQIASPVILLGHSHGALITLRALASERPPDVHSAVLSSPFLALKLPVPAWKRGLARVASRIAPRLPQRNKLHVEDLTSDPEKQRERLDDTLCFDVATSRWFTEMSEAQDYVLAHADRIAVPTTWLVGGADPIADPARARAVAAKVRGATYHDLVGLRHEVFNEAQRPTVFAALTAALATA